MSVALNHMPEPSPAKAIRLLELKLKNFKGIRDFTLTLNGHDAIIKADNEKGKSTLADSLWWLLFNKDSKGRADFEVKTLDENNEPIHGLDHEVEATFNIGGEQATLRKVYAEKWTKKKGSATQTFSGHTTDYFIDGIPTKQKDWNDYISSIIDEKIFKLLTSPTYFNDLHWKERRDLLMEVCGDVSDQEVILSDKSLSKLTEILGKRPIDKHRELVKAQQSDINKELTRTPIRIDEATRSLPDVSGLNETQLQADLEVAKVNLQAKQQELSRIENGGEVAEKQRQLAEIDTELIQIKNQLNAQTDIVVAGKRKALNELRYRLSDLQSTARKCADSIETNQKTISKLEQQMEKLRGEWTKVNGREFTFEQSDTCPACNQPLPEDQLTTAREKALADFNRRKSEQLAQISEEGKSRKTDVALLNEIIVSVEQDMEKIKADIGHVEAGIKALEAEIASLMQGVINPEENPEYQRKMVEKDWILDVIAQLKKNSQELVAEAKSEISEIQAGIRFYDGELKSIEQNQKGQVRIEELMAQEKQLAAEYERLEGELYLTEQFEKAKVKMLDSKINSRFRLARFKMYNILINQGLEQCCDVLYKGVPYSSNLNSGHRIIVGLDIIKTLSEHYGFTAPIMVDNAESVTELPEMDTQIIRLVKPEIETDEDRKKYSKLNVEVC